MAFVPRVFVRLSHRAAQWSADHMPRRRLRKWRYVSPRRRLIGLLLLSLLLGATYGYWALTNDANVRRMAGEYLRELTGAHVTVGEAHFDLFGGVRLGNVSAYISPDDEEPFFRAPEMILQHRTWSLIRGKLHVTEVVLKDPEIINEHDIETNRYAHQAMLAGGRAGLGGGSLPTIMVQNVRYRQVEVRGQMRAEGEATTGDVWFVPMADNVRYEVYVQKPESGITDPEKLLMRLDMRTGKIESLHAVASTESVARLLSGQFAEWHDKYQIAGLLTVTRGENETDGATELELMDVSMSLPPEQGGLAVTGARGSMTYLVDKDGDHHGLVFGDVTGRVAQCPTGTFTLNGRADLTGETFTFDVDIVVEDLSVPADNPASGAIGKTIDSIFSEYQPEGAMNVEMRAARDAEGRLTYSGTVQPLGMNVVYRHFSVPVQDVTGTIRFDETLGVHEMDLTGRRSGSEVSVKGSARKGPRVWAYDVLVDCINTALDDEARNALPQRFAEVWNALSPAGEATVRVHATRDDEGQRGFTVELVLNGQAEITYNKFPYRLENLLGSVSISSDGVHIDRATAVTGGNGQTRCTIYGDIIDLGEPSAMVDLNLDIWRMALDEELLAALPERAAEVIGQVGLTCSAPRVQARIVDSQDRSLDFSIRASVTDVAFSLDEMPLPVTQGVGEVTIEPGRVIVKRLRAAHGATTVYISGQVFLNEDNVGVDVSVDAPEVLVDEELLAMLPDDVQSVCRQFAPAGLAGVNVSLQRNVPGAADGGYRAVLTPQDMRIRYEAFPYPFTGIGGTVVVTPGRAELIRLTARDEDMSIVIDGAIEYGDGMRAAGLSVTARNVPIDDDLLAATPDDLAALARRFTPGGACNIDITRLDFRRAPPGPDGGSDARSPLLWYAEGTFGVVDAVVSLGLSDKSLSGRLTGKLGRNEDGLAIKGDLHFDSIHIGRRELTDLHCQIAKAYSSTMLHVDDFVGRTHGGRVSEGFAEIDLADPLEYGIRLSVEDVDLNDLLNAGVTSDEERTDMTGRLAGRLELIAVADDLASRRASGMLLISQANMVRMPVLLGMMNVVTLQLPGNAMFTEGVISYRLKGNTLVFEEIHLTGPTLGIVGSGTMDMQTEQLDLTFLGGPPTAVPRLLGLEELLEHVVREIVEIQISGTLSDPVTRTVPLRGVEDVITRLLRPGEE